jgi:hypothetical protein
MRALWAFVVVCLMAAHGVPTAQAARGRAPVARVLRADHPGLPAITAARATSLLIATRAREQLAGLSWAIAAEPPVVRRCGRVALIEAPMRGEHAHVALLAIRSARGPPGR